jgi:hypothetical protein
VTCALALAAALPFVIYRALAASRCPLSLAEEAEPPGWRAWPLLPGLSGYQVRDLDPDIDFGWTSWRPRGLNDARLFGNGVCAERGVSLSRWFSISTAYMRSEDELSLRRAPTSQVIVVAGQMEAASSDPGPLTFVAAFTPDRDGPFRFLLRVIAPTAALLALLVHVACSARAP